MTTTYQLSELGNFRDAGKDYLVFSVDNDQPKLDFYDNSASGPIKFATRNSDGMPMYLKDIGNDTYEFLSFANVTNVGFYHVDPSFDSWLDSNGSHMFDNQNITLENGTFENVFITKKKGYVYSLSGYKNLYTSLDQWTAPVINSYGSYLDNLNGYDIRLLSSGDSSFYTQEVNDGLKEYMVNGIDLSIQDPPEPPVIGNNYDVNDFSNLRTIDKNMVLIYSIDEPQLDFQDKDVDTENHKVKIADMNDNTVGILMDNGDQTYMYLDNYDNYSNFDILILVDKTMGSYLADNYSHMFNNKTINVNNAVFSNVFITAKPFIGEVTSLIGLDEGNTKFWEMPNTNDMSDYLNNVDNYDVRFYSSENSVWYNQTVQDAIRDFILTYNEENDLPNDQPTLINFADTTNLIYTKSLYENSVAYFDSAISRLEQELAEEQNIQNQLSTDEGQLLNNLQDFVNNKSQEINDKVNNINNINSELQTLVQENLNNIQSNEDLYDFLNTPDATNLNSKIIELRDTVYNSVKFLADNHRLGSNNDIIYLVNKVQL